MYYLILWLNMLHSGDVKKVEPGSTSAITIGNISNKALCRPIKYMQMQIPGGICGTFLCNVNTVILVFTRRSLRGKKENLLLWKLSRFVNSCLHWSPSKTETYPI